MKTLITEHWAGQVRGAGPNHGTRVVSVVKRNADPRALFVGAYEAFASQCRAVDEPGLAIVAIDEQTGQAAGLAVLRAQVGRHVAAIVGRHDRSDLFLPARPELSLRHLAVIVGPVTDWRRGASMPSYRILDLRSESGSIDETGRRLQGLRSEGPAILRCGGHTLFALPLGDPSDWPESAEDAWANLPERVYHDELVRAPDGSAVVPLPAARRNTVITRVTGPQPLGLTLAPGGDLAGTLTLDGPDGHARVAVGQQALRQGVLLGRYARCDLANRGGDDALSRVHALLIAVDDRLVLIDTASTNGVRVAGGTDARLLDASCDRDIELGHRTTMRWRWAS